MGMSVLRKLGLASTVCVINMALIAYFTFVSPNEFLMGYFLGFAAFSSFYLRHAINEYKKEMEAVWSGYRKSTT